MNNTLLRTLFLLTVATPIMADMTIKMQVGDEQKKHDMIIYIAAGKMRYEHPEQKGFTLWDSKTKAFTHVMKENQKYMVMDEAYIEQMTKMMSQMSGMMAQMGNNAMFGDMAKKMQAGNQEANKTRSYKKTSRTDTALNQTCRVWEVYADQIKEGEFCTVNAAAVKMGSAEMETMKAMAEFGKKMAEAMQSSMKMPGMPEAKQPDFAQVFDGNEFPIKYVRLDKEKPYTAMEYKEISSAGIDGGLFTIPAGFQKMEMKMGR